MGTLSVEFSSISQIKSFLVQSSELAELKFDNNLPYLTASCYLVRSHFFAVSLVVNDGCLLRTLTVGFGFNRFTAHKKQLNLLYGRIPTSRRPAVQ